MRGHVIVVAATLLLIGCSDRRGPDDGASAAANGAGMNTPAQPKDAPVVAAPALLKAIPVGFQGRWGEVAGDCPAANASFAKGLMVITRDRLRFYEARGAPTHITQVANGRITFALPMSGEGMTWSEPTELAIEDGGGRLVRRTSGPPDRAGVSTYIRCPA